MPAIRHWVVSRFDRQPTWPISQGRCEIDTERDIIYRTFKLNDSTVTSDPGTGVASGITGSVVDSADLSDVDVVQFLEKRSLQDGMDAGDAYLGARRVRLAGTLYAQTRALLYDAYITMRKALSPTLAQRESPADKGYLPIYFSIPTNRVAEFPTGYIAMRMLVLPKSMQAVFQRNHQGGNAGDALAIPWQATFVAKDPSMMSELPQDTAFATTTLVTGAIVTAATDLVTKNGHGLNAGDRIYFVDHVGGAGVTLYIAYYVLAAGLTANAFKISLTNGGAAVDITTDGTVMTYAKVYTISGNFVNRGNYHVPLNMLWNVGYPGGTITITAGGSNFTLVIPASAGDRIVRYKGADKLLTLEENGVEVLRMDVLTFQNATTHPMIVEGTTPFSITFIGVNVKANSHAWFWEVFA